jgi:uncharacterized protein
MHRTDVIDALVRNRATIQSYGVDALYLFGSHVRDEGRPDSDIDVFIDRQPGKPFGFLELTNLEFYLTDLFNTKVDVMTRTSLHPDLKAEIEASALKVF